MYANNLDQVHNYHGTYADYKTLAGNARPVKCTNLVGAFDLWFSYNSFYVEIGQQNDFNVNFLVHIDFVSYKICQTQAEYF